MLDANLGATAIGKSYVDGVLTLTGSAPLADFQQVLRTVTFPPRATPPTEFGADPPE